MDIGTGDGRFVLAAARADPDALVIGIDPDAASMREVSGRAARRPERGGAPNALFLVSAVEALPPDLSAIADRITVHFPWGSLLRGLLSADRVVVDPIVRLARPGATLSVLVSVTETERGDGLVPLDARTVARAAGALAGCGLITLECRPATAEDLRSAHSSWARRLHAGERRPAWLMRFVRRQAVCSGDAPDR